MKKGFLLLASVAMLMLSGCGGGASSASSAGTPVATADSADTGAVVTQKVTPVASPSLDGLPPIPALPAE